MNLPTKQQVLDGSIPRPPICGVYFLIREPDFIFYVGSSENVEARLKAQLFSEKRYDRYFILEVPPEKRLEIEADAIVEFKPPFNTSLPTTKNYAKLTSFMREYIKAKGVDKKPQSFSFEMRRAGYRPAWLGHYRVTDIQKFLKSVKPELPKPQTYSLSPLEQLESRLSKISSTSCLTRAGKVW